MKQFNEILITNLLTIENLSKVKQFKIMKEPFFFQLKTPYHIKFGMKRKQFTTHVTPNMIHINQSIREQSTNGNEQYEIKLANTSTSHNLED